MVNGWLPGWRLAVETSCMKSPSTYRIRCEARTAKTLACDLSVIVTVQEHRHHGARSDSAQLQVPHLNPPVM